MDGNVMQECVIAVRLIRGLDFERIRTGYENMRL
jgi:hypothetical protein